jgi:hypothetical protein
MEPRLRSIALERVAFWVLEAYNFQFMASFSRDRADRNPIVGNTTDTWALALCLFLVGVWGDIPNMFRMEWWHLQ